MKNTKTNLKSAKTPAVMILAVIMLIGVLYTPGKSFISGLTQPAQAETTEEENYANREMPSTQHGVWVDDEEDEETTAKPAMELELHNIDPEKTVKMLLGDVDGNGKVEASDARLALRKAVGLVKIRKNTYEFRRADYTRDFQILADDARMILRAAVGLEELKYIEVGENATQPEEPETKAPENDPSKPTEDTTRPGFTEEPTFSRFIGYDTEGNPHFEYTDYTKVCRYCGRTDCISLKIEYDENECLIDHTEDCPEYDKTKDPGACCQVCGKFRYGYGPNYCKKFLVDCYCPCCGKSVPGRTCHHCQGNQYGFNEIYDMWTGELIH